jgi:NCAIR mutase (PurE)-related protein
VSPEALEALLASVASGAATPADAVERLRHFPSERLSYATIDHHRALRQGHPEVVFCEGKTPVQVLGICTRLVEASGGFLGTRATAAHASALADVYPTMAWHETARVVHLVPPREARTRRGTVLVVCAGTSDLPVAEEAAVVADAFGHHVARLVDVGVAGIHRVLSARSELDSADVIIVVAGMEGALPSVVGGLVSRPVIAVPTSVGYGAAFGGIAALLGMLNSCASGVTVVNIDNGFGAAAAASRILSA